MSSLRGALPRPILAIFLLAALYPLHAETPNLTTDWIAGPGSRVADVPPYIWLNDGTAIIDDSTFERLDPVTAKRHPILDMSRAVARSNQSSPGADVHGALPWPIAFNRAGKQALYLFDGDIFLLDLNSSAFSRLTQTAEEEKNPQFSPNGRFVSFVRANNIYVWDLVRQERKPSSPTMVLRPR